MTLLERKSNKGSNIFQTPEWPIKLLVDFIKKEKGSNYFKNKRVWEPACGKRNIVIYLNEYEIDCFGTDIKEDVDFLDTSPDYDRYDLIITNPPFNLKTAFLKKCYYNLKPFALLLPYSTFETPERQKYFKEWGLQLLFLPKRVDFEYEDGVYKRRPWFPTAFFSHGFNFKKDINWL